MGKNNYSKKDHKMLLTIVMLIIFIVYPALFIFGLIIYAIYKNKHNIKTKINEYSDNAQQDIIETDAEVLNSTVINEKEEWFATKEYKR